MQEHESGNVPQITPPDSESAAAFEVVLAAIAEGSPCGVVEISAGRGSAAALLRQRGIIVDAFDIDPRDRALKHAPSDVAGLYPERTLVLCRLDAAGAMARDALDGYRGDALVLIGAVSEHTGTAGDDDNHGLVDHLRFAWEQAAGVPVVSWPAPGHSVDTTVTMWRRRDPHQPIPIVDGPDKDAFFASLQGESADPVTFTPRWGKGLTVHVLQIEREDGSGECWNFQARVAGTNQYIGGFYSTRRRTGSYRRRA